MKHGITELVFILDKSGSMGGLEGDTIGGFNAMLAKQKAAEGQARITTVLFDNDYELLHDRIDIRAVGSITPAEYYVGGTTALMDAVGKTIGKIQNTQIRTSAEYRADKVLFVIITDGHENASHEFSSDQIKSMIGQQKKAGWEFIFLGANIDAVEAAEQIGIEPERAQSYHADSKGVALNFKVVAEAVCAYRQESAVPADWNCEIQADMENR